MERKGSQIRSIISFVHSKKCQFQNIYSNEQMIIKMRILGVPWKDSAATEWIEVRNPATQEVVSLVPVQPLSEMEAVAESSQKAFQSWKNTSILSRQQIMLKYQELIKEHKTEIAKLITLENGYDVILT